MWTYNSTSGNLLHNGNYVGTGYSGNGQGLDDPDYEAVQSIGPIPRGSYSVGRFFDDPEGKGPLVAHLTPDPETNTFGRSGFMIHGDNVALNHSASHGCIILARALREQILASPDRTLRVI